MAILIKEDDLTRRVAVPGMDTDYNKPATLDLLKCRLWHRLTGHWHIEWSNWIPFIVCDKCHMKFYANSKRSFFRRELELSKQIEQDISEVISRKEKDLAAV